MSPRRAYPPESGASAVQWIGVLLTAMILALATIAAATPAATTLALGVRATVCAVVGSSCPVVADADATHAQADRPAILSRPAADPSALRVRTFGARGVLPAGSAAALGLGRDDRCVNAGDVDVCAGDDSRIRTDCADTTTCDGDTIEVQRIPGVACASAPNETVTALGVVVSGTATTGRHQLCAWRTRGGRGIIARCTASPGPSPREACTDGSADTYAAVTGASVTRCAQLNPARQLGGDDLRLAPAVQWAFDGICVSAGGGVYACHTTVSTSNFGRGAGVAPTPLPSAMLCDSRSLAEGDATDCVGGGPPHLEACVLRDGTPVVCLGLEGAHHHCSVDRRTAISALRGRCPRRMRRGIKEGVKPEPEAYTVAFCLALGHAQAQLEQDPPTLVVGPQGQVESVGAPTMTFEHGAALDAHAQIAQAFGAFPMPVIAGLHPQEDPFDPDDEPVPLPDADGAPDDHIAFALPTHQAIGFFPGETGAPGVLALQVGEGPYTVDGHQQLFGQMVAWAHHAFPALSADEVQLLALVHVPIALDQADELWGVGLPPGAIAAHAAVLDLLRSIPAADRVRILRRLAANVARGVPFLRALEAGIVDDGSLGTRERAAVIEEFRSSRPPG